MLRTLAYPYEAQEAKVLDRYGNVRGKIPLKTGENQLPITPYGCYLQDSLGNVFRIYDGEGVLEFSDSLRHYDFSALESISVELALNQEIPLSDLSKKWLEVYDLNITKSGEYLLPNGFKEIENTILKGF